MRCAYGPPTPRSVYVPLGEPRSIMPASSFIFVRCGRRPPGCPGLLAEHPDDDPADREAKDKSEHRIAKQEADFLLKIEFPCDRQEADLDDGADRSRDQPEPQEDLCKQDREIQQPGLARPF